jgi:hypothetical protein
LLPLHKSKETREAADRSFIAKPRKSGKRQTKKSSKKNLKGCIAKSAQRLIAAKALNVFFLFREARISRAKRIARTKQEREREVSLKVHACTEDLKSMMARCKSDGICFVSDQDFGHTHCAF